MGSFVSEMPWRGIVKVTGLVGLGLTALCAAALQAERREKQEAERFRWTDKNRWE
jgi:hypothetical protein